jgi:hypothetical protein
MNFHVSIVVDISQFSEFVHEEADAGPGCADHFRQGFLTDLSHNRLRPRFLAEVCEEKEEPGKAPLARIEQLIDQVRLNSTVPSQ